MSFIIFFATFVFVLTVRENIRLGIIVFIGMLAFSLAFQYFTKRRNKKIFLLISLAFLLSAGSFFRNNYSLSSPSQSSKSFMGTGIIDDTSSAGKYIFTTSTASYVLQSKGEHQIGEELFLVGRLSSGTFSGSAGDQGFLAFDYAKRLKMKGRKGLIYESNSSVIHANRAGLFSQIKKILQQKIISLYGKDHVSGLILGMLVGDRSLIPKEDYQNFINSGLVHLIAVSGGNIVMITVFLGAVLCFLPFYLRSAVILLTIIFYGIICGLDSSVFRAVITGGLSLLALFRGKEVPVWRLLSIAFVAMLVINPYYLVYDVGFLLSFGAVIGIILFNQKCEGANKIPAAKLDAGMTTSVVDGRRGYFGVIYKWLNYIWKNYLEPSVGATMGVFPIIIFFMGQINLLSVIGNLFVLPILPFVMIYGFASIFLFQLVHRQRLLLIEKYLILYIYKVSEFSSSFGLYLSMEAWTKRIVLLGFLIWFIVVRIKLKGKKI